MLNTHIFLLGILFQHRAFQASSLRSPSCLASLDIHKGEKELPLPLRDDLKETPIFRRAIKTLVGYEMSADKPISYQMMAQWVRRIGEILGLEYPTIPYNLRYNAANEFDRSGLFALLSFSCLHTYFEVANVSDSLRNLALDHADSRPFQRNYLGREICADTWAVVRGQKPQQALIRQACSVGHSMSKRRPLDLTAEQSASVNTDPLIIRLAKGLRRHRQGSKEYIEARRQLRNEKQRLKRQLKQKVREEWTAEQAVDDIERQLHGIGFATHLGENRTSHPQRPAQKRLVKALSAPLAKTVEDQYQRRNNAIDAVTGYCSVEEGITVPRRPTRPFKSAMSSVSEPPAERLQHAALMSVFVRNDDERPRRCFICVGRALSLSPDDPNITTLTREFYTSGDLNKHFRRTHLSNMRKDDEIECPACSISLDHKHHLLTHAQTVHGIHLRHDQHFHNHAVMF